MLDLNTQPESCRAPLAPKDNEDLSEVARRILQYDPIDAFARLAASNHKWLSNFKRYNSVFTATIFPNEPGKCACGCNQQMGKRRTRWATKDCATFGVRVVFIISGKYNVYAPLVYAYYGHNICTECGETGVDTQIDHILPVFKGGGLCWLSNLKPLCIDCHKKKTKMDLCR